ncbi:MAG: amidohydrolase family protein [Candidatus Omnitrophica bacterium]|nr:amidohydrolase family protein [Candidatus Omnitrophota bacterium]
MALLSAIVGWENLFAWYWINPIRMPSRDEMQAALTHSRVVGIKIHAYWHCLDPDQTKPVFEIAREWNLPIYLILNFGWDRKIETLLQTFPEVQVILGYAGFPYFDRIWKIVRSQNHVWVDLTSFHVDENIILAAIRQMGPERCLYGSDCPYNFRGSRGQFDYAKTLDRIQKLRLGSDKIDGILRGNAQHLLFDTAIAR